MQADKLIERIKSIRIWQRGDERAPHKPLLLLYSLARVSRGEPRLVSYKEVVDDLRILLKKFGPYRKIHYPSYPFVKLCNDGGFWEIEGNRALNTTLDWSDRDLIENNISGGFTAEVYDLLKKDNSLIKELAGLILNQYFPETLHEDILAQVGLDLKTDTKTNRPILSLLGGFDLPNCPKCNSPMVLRMARKGPKAGKQFYGCSRYPRCKCILDFDESPLETSSEPTEQFVFPHHMIARSKYRGYQASFFESVATSSACLEAIRLLEIDESYLRSFAQWRVDFPSFEPSSEWSERMSQIFSVCEKILTRGRITLCSPDLENSLSDLFEITGDKDCINLTAGHLVQGQPIVKDYWLDSEAERIFYTEIIPELLGDDFSHWVSPQVELSSLIPNSSLNGRVDFLICPPGSARPIVVEIDGQQHHSYKDSDRQRDEILIRHGYHVLRIPAEEVEKNPAQIINEINMKLAFVQKESVVDKLSKFINAMKISHQSQLTILQAVKYGFLSFANPDQWKIVFRYPEDGMFEPGEIEKVFQLAVKDIMQLVRYLGDLYSIRTFSGEPVVIMSGSKDIAQGEVICISFSSRLEDEYPTFFVQNISVPFHITNTISPTSAAVLEAPKEKTLLYFLRYLFRKEKFWEGQLDAVVRALQGKDAILLLPTGGGKSIAFQLASLILPGRTIVVEPIISLMEDQLDNLASYGIDRCIGISSLIIDAEERAAAINLFGQAEYLITYIAPERLQTIEFRESLRSLTVHTPINVVVVDEAHCVSEWGHDFRTAYLNIGRISREFCKSKEIVPPLIALTGTASRAVLKDVQRELQIEDFDAIITPKTFDRPELNFEVIHCNSSEKFPRLKGYLSQMLPNLFRVPRNTLFQASGKDTYSGLVFCPWVNGEYGVVQVSQKIQSELGIPNDYYSGKAPRYRRSSYGWTLQKQAVTRRFKYNKIPLLTCTKAFGMGIDKPNIRYTIHYGLPFSIESFYQEVGRAGRDRRKAYCCIFASNDDPRRNKELLDPSTPVERIAEIVTDKPKKRVNDDDITRALYFHVTSFRGIAAELNDVKNLIQNRTPNYDNRNVIKLTYDPDDPEDKSNTEKCLHRLLILGIIEDYTIDYSKKEFTVKTTGASKQDIIKSYKNYVTGYLGSRSDKEVEKAYSLIHKDYHQFVLEMVNLLLNFIYNVIEKGRRRALYEMYLTATENPNNTNIRQRILRYLEQTEHSEMIEALLDAPDSGLDRMMTIFEEIWSPNEAAEIRGQVSRYLESYPDYPSLLMLRALTEIYTREANQEVVKQNYFAAVKSSVENYVIPKAKLYAFIAWSIQQVYKRSENLAEELLNEVSVMFQDTSFSKVMVKELPDTLAVTPALYILNQLNKKCQALLIK